MSRLSGYHRLESQMLRVMLVGGGIDNALAREAQLDFLASGHIINLFQGVASQEQADRQIQHVDAVVHADWLDRGSFEALVDHNLGSTIHLAVASEFSGIPLFLYVPLDLPPLARRTVDMAVQVAVDEYRAICVEEGDELERTVRKVLRK